MRKFELLNDLGDVTAAIAADDAYMAAHYSPATYRDVGDYQVVQPPTEEAVMPRPSLVLTGVTADRAITLAGLGDITCETGTTLTITAELRSGDGLLLPLSDTFRMPIAAAGRDKVLLAKMLDGVVTIKAPMRDSGAWEVTEAMINAHLPPDTQMLFAGVKVFVIEA